jgi:ATP-dependent helicase/nuclease subunit B
MPARFILGRAGTGKTRHCLDALLAELEKPDEPRRLILLVPEQASFQMERTLALGAPRYGYWRAEVLSFSRLARRVFEQVGCEPVMLRPAARALALRSVVRGVTETSAAFGSAARTPGFFIQLDRLIEELLLENVTPADLTRAAGALKDAAAQRRVAALARVYGDYLEWLGPERIDPAQRLAVLREHLAGAGWLRDASVWVDGFAGLTGQELETLVALAHGAREVAVTLLLDPAATAVRDTRHPPDLLNLFHRTETTYQRLVQRLSDEGIELRPPLVLQPRPAPRFTQAEDVGRLEAALATPIGVHAPASAESSAFDPSVRPVAQVRVVECETHRDELRAAARFIRRGVLESSGALRFRDFAVIARDLEPFAPLVADVFAEYELPYFLDRRRSLGVHALAQFVKALLETVESDFSPAATTRLLRCGLLPLSRAQAERLENAVVGNEIRGLETWRRRRWDFERADPVPRAEADALDTARSQAVAALEPLALLASAGSTATAAAWAAALHETLARLQVPTRIAAWITEAKRGQDWETAELHRLAWDTLSDLLEDLHDVLGGTPIELRELMGFLSPALAELTVGLAPPTLDQVLVSAIERSRHPDIKYAWVLAFNDGIFPARPGDDVLLSAADRELLAESGLPAPRARRDEAFGERLLGYIALTRPSHGLTISYATVGDGGEPEFPSPLLDDVMRALPGLAIDRPIEDEPPVCLSELAGGYLRARAARPRSATSVHRYERLRDELRARPELSGRLERLLRGLTYENAPAAVKPYRRPAGADRGVVWDGSPSELETYLQCPFKHFVSYGLSLSAERGPAPAALELGKQAHAVLAGVTRRAIAAAEGVRDLSDDQWLRFLEEAVKEFATQQAPDLRQRRPQAAFLSAALRPFLRELVLAHAERWRRGACEPVGCELRFVMADDEEVGQARGRAGGSGRPGAPQRPHACLTAALELMTPEGERVRLHGYIDRLDRCVHEGWSDLLVYDYKSSLSGVKAPYLTQDRLQLFTYLLAVEQAFAADEQTRVAGVFLAPLYPVTSGAEGRAGVPEAEVRMQLYRPRGLFDARVARLLDQHLGENSSPVVAMRLKKDGGFYHWSDAKPRSELDLRLKLARRTVLQVAEGIVAGRIDVAPLLETKTLACYHCDFGPLCRFEAIFNRPRLAEKSLPVLAPTGSNEAGSAK